MDGSAQAGGDVDPTNLGERGYRWKLWFEEHLHGELQRSLGFAVKSWNDHISKDDAEE